MPVCPRYDVLSSSQFVFQWAPCHLCSCTCLYRHMSLSLIFCSVCRLCFFTIESTSHRTRFMAQINSSFGSGGMTLALNDVQFSALIQQLKDKQMGKELPIKKAACTIGLQPCGKIWVFTGDVQVYTKYNE